MGIVSLLSGCAGSLRSSSTIIEAPPELTQKLETFAPPPAAAGPTTAIAPETVPAAQQSSTLLTADKVTPQKPIVEKAKKTKKQAKTIPPTPTPPPAPPPPAEPAITVRPEQWPYGVGEKIVWVLRYGPIEGGVATLTVEPPKVLEGEPVIHYKGQVKSSKLLELFYKIDSEINTFMRASDHVPLRQEIRQNETGRWGKRVVIFDQKAHQAKFFQDMTKKDGAKDDVLRTDPVTPFAQDIFGALYFVRFLDTGRRVNFPVHDRWKNWNNELTYLGDEKIRVPAGEFEAHHFKMFPRVSGALTPQGDVEVWTAKDASHVILRFTAKIKVGSVTGEVRSIESGTPMPLPPPQLKTPIDIPTEGT